MTRTPSTSEHRKSPGANVRVPPPLLFVSMVLVGVGVQSHLGGSLPVARSIAVPLGVALGVIGFALIMWAGGLFQKTGQDVRPWLNTPELIVSGVYRVTRNPMYVAMAMVQAGLGFGLGNVWLLGLLPVSIVLVYLTAIRHEEAYLESKFQDSYRAYKRQVRRWL